MGGRGAKSKSADLSYQGKNGGSGRATSSGVSFVEELGRIDAMGQRSPKLRDTTPNEVFAQLEAARNGAGHVTVYRATTGDAINNGDWVFLSFEQADRFARKRFNPGEYRPGYKVLSERLPVRRVHWTGKNYEFMKVGG